MVANSANVSINTKLNPAIIPGLASGKLTFLNNSFLFSPKDLPTSSAQEDCSEKDE